MIGIGTTPSSVLCHTIPASDTGVVTYDDPEGLSRAVIVALAQDQRGYLWIGTERGPVRFDGLEWVTPASLSALSTFDVMAFDTQEPRALWVGTNGAGLWLMDTQPLPHRRLTTLTAADGLADDDVHMLCRDSAGALWVGTHHGLAVVEGRQVDACWTSQDGIPDAGISALCADPAGGVWAGSLQGLLWFDRRTRRGRLSSLRAVQDTAVYALCVDAQGHLWVGTRNGIVVLKDGQAHRTIQQGLPSPEVRALCLDRAGRIWAGTAKGLVLIEQGRVRGCWARAQHLPSSSVWTLFCDGENRLWVGTESGLALLPQQSMPVQTLALGAAIDGAYGFATDQRQQTWIGTAHGLVTVASDARTETTPATLPAILAQAGAWVVHRDGAGRMWAGGRYGGLFCLDPATGRTLAHVDAVNAVRCLVDDPDGRLWIGTLGAGLACLDMSRSALLYRLTVAQGLPSDHVSSLCLDGYGQLWVGTLGGGLACVDRRRGAVTRTLASAEGLPHLAVSGLALGPGDQMWATTQGGGLFRVDLASDRVDGVWTVADGLPSDTLVSCVVDTDGALWLGTARGLTRYQQDTGSGLTLGRPHGLPSEYCQQGALRLDEQGRLWLGTMDGVAVVAAREAPRAIPACNVYLSGVRVMGQERDLIDGLEIEDTDYDLAVDYGAVTFVAAAQVLYRTQLVGLDAGWSQPHAHRFARYTNLRPGEYTFRVAARNWGGHWSAPAEWRFRVVRNRREQELEQARQRAEAAEAGLRIRNEILSTVAHDLGAPLTAIMGYAELLQSRLARAEPPSQDWLRTQASALHNGALRMAAMVEEIVDVAHLQMGQRLALQVAPVDVGTLVQSVARALAASGDDRLVLQLDTSADLTVEGDGPRLERVVQNLIGNAIKYSLDAAPIHVSVRREKDGVTICVQDSGVGIPAAELPHIFTPYYRASTSHGIPGTGLGLSGARTIVEQHGGCITLESRVDVGTTATVYLPRQA